MSGRITILPDDRLAAVQGVVEERLEQAAALLNGEAFDEFFDATMRTVFDGCLARSGAHEGTVWLLDEARSALVPRYNNGPNATNFVGTFRQDLSTGMISAVAITEQPMCENEVHRDGRQDPRLDQRLGVRTCAMLAVPFYFAGELRGVLSAVQLSKPGVQMPEPAGFPPEALGSLQLSASILAGLMERRLLGQILGLEEIR
jgi:GAF domain-containing protein